MSLLENKSISLRAPEPEDLDLLYLWENDTSVWRISGTLVPFSRFVLKQYLENAAKDIFEMKQVRLIIQLNKNKRPIGAIDLFDFDPHHRRAGVGILIADQTNRQQGYARESLETIIDYCFKFLNLHQLYCNISSSNTASIKLFTAAGFEVVGEKKEWLYNGEGFEGELLLQYIPSNQ